MKIKFAHLRTQGIDFAVFNADVKSQSNQDRADILAELTSKARSQGLKIDKSALVFKHCGKLNFYGVKDLVNYLSNNWNGRFTHTIEL